MKSGCRRQRKRSGIERGVVNGRRAIEKRMLYQRRHQVAYLRWRGCAAAEEAGGISENRRGGRAAMSALRVLALISCGEREDKMAAAWHKARHAHVASYQWRRSMARMPKIGIAAVAGIAQASHRARMASANRRHNRACSRFTGVMAAQTLRRQNYAATAGGGKRRRSKARGALHHHGDGAALPRRKARWRICKSNAAATVALYVRACVILTSRAKENEETARRRHQRRGGGNKWHQWLLRRANQRRVESRAKIKNGAALRARLRASPRCNAAEKWRRHQTAS